MIGHDPDSGRHRVAQDVAYRPHQVSAVIYAFDAYIRAAEIRDGCQPFVTQLQTAHTGMLFMPAV